ncbi:MAG: MSMEG_1061 family FMN-dependent PPOX-type flavoprotein [Pseudomonadales bacterium]
MNDDYIVKTEDELELVIGPSLDRLKEKIYQSLDEAMIEFVRRSPLMFLSTVDSNGQADVSPKGDSPGFVHVDVNGNLLIPDRPGNRLIFGFKNILRNSNVGAIFVVPNMRETLRIKGKASISRDPAVLRELSERGKPALLCTHISIDECFFHCGKAMIRSNKWKPDAWAGNQESLMLKSIVKRYDADNELKREIETEIEEAYRDNLY